MQAERGRRVANPSVSNGVATFTTGATLGYSIGLHTLYVFAGYGDEGGQQPGDRSFSTAGMFGNEPQVSQVVSYTFQIDPVPTSTNISAAQTVITAGTNDVFTAVVTPTVESTGSVMFTDTTGGSTYTIATVAVSNGTAISPGWDISYGTHTITATFVSANGYVGQARRRSR